MRGALLWAGGLGASVALNGALGLGLAAMVAPDPPRPATPAAPQFDITSYPVPQSTAPEAPAQGTPAPESVAGGTRATGRAVPQSRATAAALPFQRAPLADAPTETAAPQRPRGAPVASTAALPFQRAPLADAPAETIVPQRLQGAAVASAVVQGAALAGLDATAQGAVLSAIMPSSAPAAPVVAAGAVQGALAPRAVAVAPVLPAEIAAPPAATQAAALAGVPLPVLPRLIAKSPQARATVVRATVQLGPVAGPAVELTATALSAVAPVTVALNGVAMPALRVAADPAPQLVMSDTALSAPPIIGGVPIAPSLAAQVAVSPATPAAEIAPDPVASARPTAVALRQAPAGGSSVAPSDAPAPLAPAQPPRAERQLAALAWSGEGAAALDPVSLAAIQAFAKADDLAGDGPRVRDAIGGLLAEVPCARLQTVFDPATGALELRGHLPDPGLRSPILAALRAQVGGAIPVADATLILPRPQCGALAAVEAVGLPQSDEQVGDPRVIGERPFAAQWGFAEGEVLEFRMLAPDYPAFIYVDYFQADGQVFHLQPNAQVPLRAVAPKEVFHTGERGGGLPNVQFLITPPFGQEIMVAFASSVPLYAEMRPIIEPAAAYLEFLKGAVARAQAKTPDFQGEWYYFFVTTRP